MRGICYVYVYKYSSFSTNNADQSLMIKCHEICPLLRNYAAYSGNSPTFRDNLAVPKSPSRITTIWCVISQKSADFIHFAAEAWNRALKQCNFRNVRNSFHSDTTSCLRSLRPVKISPCLSGSAWSRRTLAGVWLKLRVLDFVTGWRAEIATIRHLSLRLQSFTKSLCTRGVIKAEGDLVAKKNSLFLSGIQSSIIHPYPVTTFRLGKETFILFWSKCTSRNRPNSFM
jgi:hypothetical protein